ncbi:hypothetical protein ACE6H2_017622 [Prunus campanulata]
MVYSYKHGFSGFAAKVTESQAQKIAELPGVIRVMPSHFYSLQTTRSWDYLGLSPSSPTNLLHDTNLGDGIVIGLLDTGIWPESKVFNDEGFGPIPNQWKGQCVSGESFNASADCNKKLKGAKWYIDGFLAENKQPFNTTDSPDFLSPRDVVGHGTHTSTIAGGSFVYNASYRGLGLGSVRGGAPRARLAMYKVCWNVPRGQCSSADILKAFDDAIHDGVELMLYQSISWHPTSSVFRATTIDRSFPTPITLGNNLTILGQAIFAGKEVGFTGLVYPENPGLIPSLAGVCESLLLNNTPVAGNVVLCFTTVAIRTPVATAVSSVRAAGGVGVFVAKAPGDVLGPCSNDFPCIEVDYELGTQILFYIRSTRSPTVKLSPSATLVGKPVSTKVATFSSRGPNSIAPVILKPDIAAPGVSILAGSSPYDPFMDGGFALHSGTSMATPHVSGIVALLKALHSNWSPAAIRSALVTTGSSITGSPQKVANPFDYGGGLVNPNKASDPGLIYEMGTEDYIKYLCAVGYNTSAISQLVGQTTACSTVKPSVLDVNLPSITIPNLRENITLNRSVTNVGPVNSVYKANIDPPPGISVAVRPDTLVFNSTIKTISFTVAVSTTHQVNTGYYFGSLTWTDGEHLVTSPISVRTQIIQNAFRPKTILLFLEKENSPTNGRQKHHSKEAAYRSIIYSYKHGFSGFAARLTESQAEAIAGMVFSKKLHDEHPILSSFIANTINCRASWSCPGVWPESESFNDEGMNPIPTHWKGICQHGEHFNSTNCNRKIIGARWFRKGAIEHFKNLNDTNTVVDFLSPRDGIGHGTHTASTAAGYFVKRANYRGLASGLARGGAPLAQLAIYKACWAFEGCTDADLLKAFDKAIHDGVDILSLSVGNVTPLFSYVDQRDSIAIGSFHATAKGITVVCSAGNDGPISQTIVNTAPWLITVAATTIDRAFPTAITLGNNHTLWGQSIDIGKHKHGFVGIIYSERIALDRTNDSAKDCQPGSLNATLASGKIVLCFSKSDQQDIESASNTVQEAGGVGLIFAQFPNDGLASCDIPCIRVGYEVGTQILSYIRKARFPIAKLSDPKTVIGKWVSPRVASFSASQTGTDGTSISAEGLTRKEADPFDIGGGHVDPNKAIDPGLIFDASTDDYIQFLCSLGYSSASITRLTKTNINCITKTHGVNLNLPSITIPNLKRTATVTRTVTNVGHINSKYKALVHAPPGIKMTVEPQTLSFNITTQILPFKVTFFTTQKLHGDYKFGSLTWTDGEHLVRSPVAIRVIGFESYNDV